MKGYEDEAPDGLDLLLRQRTEPEGEPGPEPASRTGRAVVLFTAAALITAIAVLAASTYAARKVSPTQVSTVAQTATSQAPAPDPMRPAAQKQQCPGPATAPNPGGGPQVILMVQVLARKVPCLLDPVTGQYRALPFDQVALSPDLTEVAVSKDRQVGVAARTDLLTNPASAVQWLDLPIDQPAGTGPLWSPDGTALLLAGLEPAAAAGGSAAAPSATASTGSAAAPAAKRQRYRLYRYDLPTGKVTSTRVPTSMNGDTIGWAADSRRYLGMRRSTNPNDDSEPGALQYLHADGTLGQYLAGGRLGVVDGATSYSPSRRYLVARNANRETAKPWPSKVVDLRSGRVTATVPADSAPVGWYDDKTLALLVHGELPKLALLDVASGKSTRTIDLPGMGDVDVQIGPSAGLSGSALSLGF